MAIRGYERQAVVTPSNGAGNVRTDQNSGASVRDFRDSVEGKEPRAPIASTSCVNCNSAILDGSKFCPGCGLQAPTVARERRT